MDCIALSSFAHTLKPEHGGCLRSGQHVRYTRNTPLCNLYLEMLDRMGVRQERFGDSTGRLTQLT